eukprot:493684-Hanusia_phi.AAC.3
MSPLDRPQLEPSIVAQSLGQGVAKLSRYGPAAVGYRVTNLATIESSVRRHRGTVSDGASGPGPGAAACHPACGRASSRGHGARGPRWPLPGAGTVLQCCPVARSRTRSATCKLALPGRHRE